MTHYIAQPKFDPVLLEPMRQLWEETSLSAAQIAEALNVTKSTVIGHAHRRAWKPRKPWASEPTTIHQRLDAHHAKLDKVLADTRPHVEGRKKSVIADAELVGVAAE